MEDLVSENGKREARLKDGRTVKEYAKAAAVDEETGPVFSERSAVVTDAPNIPQPPFWGVRVVRDYDPVSYTHLDVYKRQVSEERNKRSEITRTENCPQAQYPLY